MGYDDVNQNSVTTNGWTFRHVVACPVVEVAHQAPLEPHWWLASPADGRDIKLGRARWLNMLFRGTAISDHTWQRTAALTPEISAAVYSAFGVYPQMVQPDLIFKPNAVKAEADRIKTNKLNLRRLVARSTAPDGIPHLELGGLPGSGWAKGPGDLPPYDPLWHQGERFSQLALAKQLVRATNGSAGAGIRVGILDDGYDHHHLLIPRNTLGSDGQPGSDRKGELLGDAISVLGGANRGGGLAMYPGDANGEHGTKAMSILAGGAFTLKDPRSGERQHPVISPDWATTPLEIGGVPDAVIVPARVAPWIFSHSTANLAYAIDYASRVRNCDVISMSHGGTPSAMWIDAVNAAYERGTAIFAATGDYYNLPWIQLGIIAPSATVFPAACRRVVAVDGVTANGEPYGRTDLKHYGWYYLAPWHWLPMRGSFGADGGYRDIFHTSGATMRRRADKPETDRGGVLRAAPISAWTPNIASAQPPTADKHSRTNILNLDWDGTSAATPQAAAAAALWLAMHGQEIKARRQWHSWQKAEAVYVAMLKSADGIPPQERQLDLYRGAGNLKAAEMLKVTFADACATEGSNQLQFPPHGMARDFFDGQRSGAAILGWEREFPPYRQRADARIGPEFVTPGRGDRQCALETIYMNQLLVREWNLGHNPQRAPGQELAGQTPLAPTKSWLVKLWYPDEPELKRRARAMAEAN